MPAVSLALTCVLALLGVGLAAVAARHRPEAPRAVYVACLALCALGLATATTVLVTGTPGGELALPMGLPWLGAHLRLDLLSAFFLLVVNLAGALASLYALGYAVERPTAARILPFFPAFLAGMNLVLLADDAFTFLLAWEFMSLASWALVLAEHEARGTYHVTCSGEATWFAFAEALCEEAAARGVVLPRTFQGVPTEELRSPAPRRVMLSDAGAIPYFSRLPALDGLRGLAVAVVVLFHGDWPWAKGGFLGVSLFFTLSGFLITSLLISEHRQRRSVDLAAFWGRRFRRLLPAALLTLAAVTGVLIALDELTGSARLDIWASMFNVANWRFLASGSSYNDLFAEPSPLRHFWSLAIEEQAYLVLPFVVALALRAGRRSLRNLAIVLGVGWGLSVAITLLLSDPDRIYYGTDTRASELLVGALLAVAVAHEPFRRRVALGLVQRGLVQVVAVVALAASVAAWGLVAVDDPIVSSGGLVLVGLLSAALVLGAALGVGPVARIGALGPLRFLGRISYGVYLFHWPVVWWLTSTRLHIGPAPTAVVQILLTFALATASHRYLEQPIRTGRLVVNRQRVVVPVLAMATVAAMAFALPAPDKTRIVALSASKEAVIPTSQDRKSTRLNSSH